MAALPVPNGGTFGSECGTSEIEIIKNGGICGIVKKKVMQENPVMVALPFMEVNMLKNHVLS